jgi:hypothetical protein
MSMRWLAVFVGLVGCGPAPSESEPPNELDLAAEAEALAIGPGALAYASAGRDALIHGVAGDKTLIFVTEPLTGRVVALSRLTGREIADLPAPAGGFLLPFALRTPEPGRLVVLDAGGFPSPTQPAVPVIYDYEYSYKPLKRRFEAELVRTVSFAGLPLVFSEDVEVLPDGRYVVSESVIGALWIVHPDGSVAPGIFPASPAPDDAVPGLGACPYPAGLELEVGGVPYTPMGEFMPGVGSLAARDGWLYFGNSCLGGVRRVPISSLEDPTRPPHARGDDIEVVSPRPEGVPVESIKGLAFDRWSDDDRLFATDAFGLGAMRIDVHTKQRQPLVRDEQLFNLPVSAQFLPPLFGITSVVVASDQEHRFAALNMAIASDQFQPPWLLTKVILAD